MMSLKIKLYDKIYAGFMPQSECHPLPFCYLCEYGTDSYAKKRMERIAHFAGLRNMEPVILENKPISGFKFNQTTVDRAHSKTCIIEDPRGFETSISIKNMARILLNAMVINGEIMTKCVWAKDGSDDILIPVTSPEYQQALANTERFNSKVNMRTVKPGFDIIRRDGYMGTFYGAMHEVSLVAMVAFDNDYNMRFNRATTKYSIMVNRRREYLSLVHAPDSDKSTARMDASKTMKISKVLKPSAITLAESEAIVNDYYSQNRLYNRSTRAYLVDPDASFDVELVPTSIADIKQMDVDELLHADKQFAARLADGREMLFFGSTLHSLGKSRHTGYGNVFGTGNFNVYGQAVKLDEVKTGTFETYRISYYNPELDDITYKVEETDIVEVYDLVLKITTKAGAVYRTKYL